MSESKQEHERAQAQNQGGAVTPATKPSRDGYTNDPRMAIQFATRKAASDAAVSIHWRRNDVREIEVMGFRLWTICDEHCAMLTDEGFLAQVRSIVASFKVTK